MSETTIEKDQILLETVANAKVMALELPVPL